MENVHIEMERKTKSLLDLLREFLTENCVQNCAGQWLSCALQTLTRNGYTVGEFSQAVHSLLELGRGKTQKYFDNRASQLWENIYT